MCTTLLLATHALALILSISLPPRGYFRSFQLQLVRISGFLWYMIIGALLIPFAGVLTFAIANFYSVQEYPIGFFLDLLHTVVKKRGFADAMSPSTKQNDKGKKSVKLGMSGDG